MKNNINQLLSYLVNDIIDNTYFKYHSKKEYISIDEKMEKINKIDDFKFLIKDDFNKSRKTAKKILKFMIYYSNLNQFNNMESESKQKYEQIFNYLKELNSVKFYDSDNYPLLYQTLTNIVYDFDFNYSQAYYIFKFILKNEYFVNTNESEVQVILNELDYYNVYIDSNLSEEERFNISEKLVSKTYQKYVLPMKLIDEEHIGTIDNELIDSMVIFGKPLKDYFNAFTDVNINSYTNTFEYY